MNKGHDHSKRPLFMKSKISDKIRKIVHINKRKKNPVNPSK